MLHILKLIERRHPRQASRIIGSLWIASAGALTVGFYLLLH